MDLITLFQVLRRRWFVFGAALLLTAVTAVFLSRGDNATYGSQGAVVIVRGAGAGGIVDGIEGSDPALQQTARLLGEVASNGGAGPVTVFVDQQLPVLRLTATADTGTEAAEAVSELVATLPQTLTELAAAGQLAIPDGTEIRQLVPPTTPEATETEDGDVEFVSTATLLLTRATDAAAAPRMTTGVIDPSNNERFVASVVFERMNDDGIRREMEAAGATAELELEFDEDAPIIRVLATSDDADEALVTGQVAIDTMQAVAADIQTADEIPEDLRFRVEALSYPLFPFVEDDGTLRTLLSVIALGLLASIGLALMIDAAATRRREQAALRAGTTADAATAATGVDGAAQPDAWSASRGVTTTATAAGDTTASGRRTTEESNGSSRGGTERRQPSRSVPRDR